MLVNAAGQAFVGKRIDNQEGDWWQMPQGGVDRARTSSAAMLRELGEEAGVGASTSRSSPGCREELFYDLPPELSGKLWGGKYRGQRQSWFLVRFTGARLRHRPRRAPAPRVLRVEMGRSRAAARADRAVQTRGLSGGGRRVSATLTVKPRQFCVPPCRRDRLGGQHGRLRAALRAPRRAGGFPRNRRRTSIRAARGCAAPSRPRPSRAGPRPRPRSPRGCSDRARAPRGNSGSPCPAGPTARAASARSR